MRYAADYKSDSEPLDQFIRRKGGINECAARYSRRVGRGAESSGGGLTMAAVIPANFRRVITAAAGGNVIGGMTYIFGSLAAVLSVKFFEKAIPSRRCSAPSRYSPPGS
jgi:hypothetical protein